MPVNYLCLNYRMREDERKRHDEKFMRKSAQQGWKIRATFGSIVSILALS